MSSGRSTPNGFEPDPYHETTEEWGWDEPEGCLHGVPWDEDCWLCDEEEDQFCD